MPGDEDGFVVDSPKECDASLGEGDDELSFVVEVVCNEDVGWPAKLVSVVSDVFGWIAGVADGRIEDWALGVEPIAGCGRDTADSFEVFTELTGDGALLPEVVGGFDMVGPSQLSRWRHDDLDPEEQTGSGPVGPWIVGVGGLDESIVNARCSGD